MIEAVEQISLETIELVSNIRDIMAEYKSGIRDKYRFYSQDLLNNLFHHLYTRIAHVTNEPGVF